MEMKSMVCRPESSFRDFYVSAIRISFLFLIIAFIITSSPAASGAAKARQLTDLQKATQLYNKGKYEQAIPLLKKHVEKKPEPEVLYMIGYSLYKLGRHDEAREYFKQSYLVEPEYSPTPVLEKKLNRRLKNARPGAGDTKQSVPQGELPLEAQGLDPSQYKVIDKSSRLKMPETTKSTDTFEPVPARRVPVKKKPSQAKKKKPAQVASKKEPPVAVTEPEPVADRTAPSTAPAVANKAVPAPAPAVANKTEPAPSPAPAVANKAVPATSATAPSAESRPAPRPTPRQAPSARPAPGAAGDEMPLPDWLAPLLGGGVIFMALGVLLVIILLFGIPLFIIARKLGVQRPVLAFVPIVQNWTLTSAAELSFIWGLLITFIPFLALYPIMLVSERLGKGKVLGLILALLLGPLGLLILAIIGKAGGTGPAASDMPDLSGEPDLDLPDMDDMGFDLEDDAFATDEGFGSDEGVGEHTDDFGIAEADSGGAGAEGDFDMDLEPSDDDFDTLSGDSGGEDDFSMDDMNLGGMDDAGGSDHEDEDSFGVDFDDKSF